MGRQGWVLPGISYRQFTRFKCQLQSGKNFLALNLLVVCVCVLADKVVFSRLVYWGIPLVPKGVRNWDWEQPGGDIKDWTATLLPPILSLYCLCLVTHATGVNEYVQNAAYWKDVFQTTLWLLKTSTMFVALTSLQQISQMTIYSYCQHLHCLITSIF